MQDAEEINSKLDSIVTKSKGDLLQKMSSLGIGGSKLKRSVKTKTATDKSTGLIKRIRYTFNKEGVYVHKGVGRGTNASQAGSTKRKAKEWFNPVIEKVADQLVEAVADGMVELTFKKLRID
jgi:hypothetical protein